MSLDPVAGGSASAYDYCNADPVNCTDLGGTFTWKGALKALAVVGEVASMIPGPVGAIAGGVSAVAYLATGDKQKALAAAGGAVLGLVGLGAVAGAVKVARGVAAGRAAAGAAPKLSRAVNGVRLAAKVAKSHRAIFSEFRFWHRAYESKTLGALSKKFGDKFTEPGAVAGTWNRGRLQVGWSGARVARVNGKNRARTVFRISVKKSDGSTKHHVNLGWGPWR